jgi:hypothetical protein
MRDKNFDQLISEFDLIILEVLFSSKIQTDEDYLKLSLYFDENE